MNYIIKIDNVEYDVIDKNKIWKVSESFLKQKKQVFKNVEYTNQELYDRFQRTKNKPILRLKNKVSYYKEKNLPINPYILGYWLGDGYSNRGCIIVENKLLKETVNVFKSKGYSITNIRKRNKTNCSLVLLNYKGEPLQTMLRDNNLLNNKHIPKDYIYSSVEQRRELIKGLLDSDGSIKRDGMCDFTQKNTNIMGNFSTILWSLGIKNYPYLNKTYIKKTKKYYNRYKVSFYPYNFNPFNLKYKQVRVKKKYSNRVKYSSIKNIERC